MKKNKIIAILCVSIMAMTMLAGCGASKEPGSSEAPQDKKELLKSMMTSEEELGIASKYNKVADITDGTVDPELVGVWKTADQSFTYHYNEDGTAYFESTDFGNSDPAPYTCLTVGDHQIVCQETTMVDYSDDAEKETAVMSYNTYKVDGDVMYQVVVDDVYPGVTYVTTALLTYYRADESGDIAKALSDNPEDPEYIYGEWNYEGGTITIDDKGMTVTGGPDELGLAPLPISITEDGGLEVEANETTTKYRFNLTLNTEFKDDTKKEIEKQEYGLNLFYTGADKDDRPNLADIMEDWNKDYGYEEYLYNLTLTRPAD